MVTRQPPHLYTLADFQEFISKAENQDRLFELINGEIIEVSPGRTRNSEFGHLIAAGVHVFCRQHKLPCHTSGGDGAYHIQGHVAVPDFAYKPTPMSDEYPDPVPPLWAVEIISPTDKPKAIEAKRKVYRDAGILLWEMYPKRKGVDVYVPGQPVKKCGIDDILDVGDILPGFTIAVRDIFGEPSES